ncbi:unnamed protein product, partial [Symbiodinium sp. CCMP2592]
SYTIPAKSCGASSVGVVAGAQKLYYVPKTPPGGLPALVRKRLGLKAQVFPNTSGMNITWAKFGMAFGWEIAAICSVQKEVEPAISTEAELIRRWKEVFPNAPEVLPMMMAPAGA